MTIKKFALKNNLNPKVVLDALVAEGFSIQSLEQEIDTRMVNAFKKSQKNRQRKGRGSQKVSSSRKDELLKVNKEVLLEVRSMSVGEFSKETKIPLNELIIFLMKENKFYPVNHILTSEEVRFLSNNFSISYTESTQDPNAKNEEIIQKKNKESEKHLKKRNPVVVIMGHVDHGKTTLLDYIRKENSAKKEKGGITQHLGAYEVSFNQRDITFLDTPGHEAFTALRVRGGAIADIALLIVAANEGLKPQTIEAIRILKESSIKIILVITKIDVLHDQNYEKIFTELAGHGIILDTRGGDVPVVFISAKTGKNINELLEMICFVSDLSHIAVDEKAIPQGYILESRMEKGRGAVATVISQQGIFALGDLFLVDSSLKGKITGIFDSFGKRAQSMCPGRPYVVSGFEAMPNAGALIEKKDSKKDIAISLKGKSSTISNNKSAFKADSSCPLLIKTDTFSSLQAIFASIKKFEKNLELTKLPYIVESGVGPLTEKEASVAEGMKANVFLFNTDLASPRVGSLLKRDKIEVQKFDVIYNLIDAIEQRLHDQSEKEEKTEIGKIKVLVIFHFKQSGTSNKKKIIGFRLLEGKIKVNSNYTVSRNEEIIGEGKILTLEKSKISCKELSVVGDEGAISVSGYDSIEEGDILSIYLKMKK
jgi:translation initiation factor IF-2